MVFRVGIDSKSQSKALEKCSYLFPGTVCLTSRKVSKCSESVISVQPDATILVLLGQANKLAYLCTVEDPHRLIKEAAVGPFPPYLTLAESSDFCTMLMASITSSPITMSF